MMNTNNTLMRLPEVMDKVGFRHATIYRMISRGEFPKPHKIGVGRMSAWRSDEIDQWIDQQTGRAA